MDSSQSTTTRHGLCISTPSVEDLRRYDDDCSSAEVENPPRTYSANSSAQETAAVAVGSAYTSSSASKDLLRMEDEHVAEVTVTAPVNIAVIKYWGKRDDDLMLPANSSLSVTLSQDILNSRTTVRCDPAFATDRLWLNGIEVALKPRVRNLLALLREIASKHHLQQQQNNHQNQSKNKSLKNQLGSTDQLPRYALNMHIVSENNFPTAAGLASSASGYAALVYAGAALLDIPLDLVVDLSRLARLGSGSACRSMLPGFVVWDMGRCADGADSHARALADHTHWPEFEAFILVLSDAGYQKSRPSTDAMASSVRSSPLAPFRYSNVVPARLAAMETAIYERNFDDFAELCMRDSNQFHAICLDSFPPIFYLNDLSRLVIALIHDYNATPLPSYPGKYKAAYTFDAGPNAVICTTRPFVRDLLVLFEHYFPPRADTPHGTFFADSYNVRTTYKGCNNILKAVHTSVPVQPEGSIKRILHTRLGDGPRLLARGHAPDISLLNCNGFPRRVRD